MTQKLYYDDPYLRSFTAEVLSVAGAVERLHVERARLHRRLESVRLELAVREGERIRAGAEAGPGGVLLARAVLEDRDAAWLAAVAGAVTAPGKAVAVLGARSEGRAQLCFARSADLDLDLRPALTEVLPRIGGKGGGRPQAVQAGGSDPEGVAPAVEAAATRIRALLA